MGPVIKKLAFIALIVFIGVSLDVVYLFYARTRGGLGFRFKILPEFGGL